MGDTWAAAVALVALAKKLRPHAPKTMHGEVDVVIERANRAIDEEEQRAMQASRAREQIRDLKSRKGFRP